VTTSNQFLAATSTSGSTAFHATKSAADEPVVVHALTGPVLNNDLQASPKALR